MKKCVLNIQGNITFTTTLQESSSTFIQQPLIVKGVFVKVKMTNLNLIVMFKEPLHTVIYADCNVTFETVPKTC